MSSPTDDADMLNWPIRKMSTSTSPEMITLARCSTVLNVEVKLSSLEAQLASLLKFWETGFDAPCLYNQKTRLMRSPPCPALSSKKQEIV